MRDQEVIRNASYVEFIFNDGAETVRFSNFEILGDLAYTPAETQETFRSESGATFSLARKQQEKVSFTLKYDDRTTRTKIARVRNYIKAGYKLNFRVPSWPTTFTGFPFESNLPTAEDPAVAGVTMLISPAVVEFPSDFSFDRSARGEAMTILEGIEVTVYRSGSLPVPTSECSLVSIADFALSPWNLDTGNELLSILLELNSGGLIDSITSYPPGTITYISGGSGDGSSLDIIEWSGTVYEPINGPFIVDGTYTVNIPNIPILLKSGQACTFTFTQTLAYNLNAAPVASSVLISGTTQQGQALTLTWTYFDNEGDLRDSTPIDDEVWFAYPTLTDANNNTNAVQLQAGPSYTIGAGIVGYYIRAKVKPYAQTGTSPGAEVFSNVLGPVITNVVAYTVNTTKTTSFSIVHSLSAAAPVGIDWGDGSAIQIFTSVSGSNTYAKTLPSGTKTVRVFVNPALVTSVTISSQTVTAANFGSLNLANSIVANFNPGLNLPTLPNPNTASTWASLALINCGMTGTLNLSSLGAMPAVVNFNGNVGLTGFVGKAGAGKATQIQGFGCNLTGVLNLAGVDVGGNLQFNTNPNLTGFVIDTSTTKITNFLANSCRLTGTLDLTALDLGGVINLGANSLLTAVLLTPTTGLISEIRLNNTGITSANFSGFPGVASIFVNNCPSLTSLTLGTGSTQALFQLRANDCALGYVNTSGTAWTENALIYLGGNGWTAAIVNQVLVDLASVLPSGGSGIVSIGGSNAAPDTTSGGFNGVAAAATISGKGHTVITS